MSRKCIVCSRAIKRITKTIRFREPRGEKCEGDTECLAWENVHYLKMENWPASRHDLQRYTNHQILTHRKKDGRISQFTTWDGESYAGKYFCTDRCAIAQGHAAAHHGYRFIWRDQ